MFTEYKQTFIRSRLHILLRRAEVQPNVGVFSPALTGVLTWAWLSMAEWSGKETTSAELELDLTGVAVTLVTGSGVVVCFGVAAINVLVLLVILNTGEEGSTLTGSSVASALYLVGMASGFRSFRKLI